ncbi:NUDIX-like domain-containing protein, partial [Congregibacter sp.]
MLDLDQSAPVHRNDALHIVFQSGKLVMDMKSRQPCILTDDDLTQNNWKVAREQYIGHWAGQACFAVEIDDIIAVDTMRYQVSNLYHLLGRVEDSVFALAGRAAQLLDWQRDHR